MFSFDSSLTVTESAVTGTPDHKANREWLRIASCFCRNTVRATNCRPARSPPFVWQSKHSACEVRYVPAPCIHRPRKSGYTNYSGCFGKMRSDGFSGRIGRTAVEDVFGGICRFAPRRLTSNSPRFFMVGRRSKRAGPTYVETGEGFENHPPRAHVFRTARVSCPPRRESVRGAKHVFRLYFTRNLGERLCLFHDQGLAGRKLVAVRSLARREFDRRVVRFHCGSRVVRAGRSDRTGRQPTGSCRLERSLLRRPLDTGCR